MIKSDLQNNLSDENRLLTIMIPTFNGEATIERVLTSVISEIEFNMLQNLVRVIVRDNCSTDSTFTLVSSMISERNWIQILRTDKNIGLDNNLIIGIPLVETMFVKLLCDDDLLLPGYITNLLSIIQRNPDADLILSGMQTLGRAEIELNLVKPSNEIRFDKSIDFVMATKGGYGQLSTLCFKTSSWIKCDTSPLLSDRDDHYMEFIARFYQLAISGICIFDNSLLMEYDPGPKRWYGNFLDLFIVNCSAMSYIFRIDSLDEDKFPNRDTWKEWLNDSKKSHVRQLFFDLINLRANNTSVRDESILKYVPFAVKSNSYFLFFIKILDFTPKFIWELFIRLENSKGKRARKFKNLIKHLLRGLFRF